MKLRFLAALQMERRGQPWPWRRVLLGLCALLLASGPAQAQTAVLGVTNRVEGPSAGLDSVVLAVSPAGQPWTATANAAWLHLDAADQSGTGSTNMVFSFAANPGATRTGTLTVAGQTLTITQAGATYLPVNSLITLASSGLNYPTGVAVDGAGNAYIADYANHAIKEWSAATGQITTLLSAGLNYPSAVAVDGRGNVDIADSGNNAIKQWSAAGGQVTTLVSAGLSYPAGVAVDAAGNVYIADAGNNAIKQWSPASGQVTTLVAAGLNNPWGVTVDGAGNLYIADSGNNVIKQWSAAIGQVTTLVAAGLNNPTGVAVDGAGNFYVADTGNNAIWQWSAAGGLVTALVAAGLNNPTGVTVDGAGNVYIADSGNNAIEEWPRAFLDPSAKLQPAAAGSAVLPTVLPVAVNLAGTFAPTSDADWLTITGTTNGVVSYSFTANPAGTASRTAHVAVLGHSIPVYQASTVGVVYILATNALSEAGAAGHDSVALTVVPNTGAWTATVDAPWLHLDPAGQAGTGSATVSFSFEDNPGGPRTGTLTIAGQTLTIRQAPPAFVLGASRLYEKAAAGGDTVRLTAPSATAPWSATANNAWLHLSPANQSGTGSPTLRFTFEPNPGGVRAGTLTVAGQTLLITQAATPRSFALGTTNLVEGSSAGVDSVVLGVFGPATNWTATADAPWLHLNSHTDHGTGSTNVVFTFDANPGATRTGTLTIGGLPLLVTQAGANYVPTSWVGPLDYSDTFTNSPCLTELFSFGTVTADGAGNSYWYDFNDGTYCLGPAGDPSSIVLFTTQAVTGYSFYGFGVDGAGNLYFPNVASNTIIRWSAADGSLVALPCPIKIYADLNFAVDCAGNCYFANPSYGNIVYKRSAADGTVASFFSLHDFPGLHATGVSWFGVDGSGNLYFLTRWQGPTCGAPCELGERPRPYKRSITDGSLVALLGTDPPYGNSGWGGLAAAGDFAFMNDYGPVMVLPRAFVDPTTRTEWADAGGDCLPAVVPAVENLTGPFAPASDQPWLTITGDTNGVVSYSFTANTTGAQRTAHVTVLGVTIPVTQLAVTAPMTTALGFLPGGGFQFSFTGTPGASYTVLSTTNLALPKSAWTVAGMAVESSTGQFQFTASPIPGGRQQFFQVHSP